MVLAILLRFITQVLRKLAKYKKPTATAWFGDVENTVSPYMDPRVWTEARDNYGVNFRHGGSANFVFADGHAAAQSSQETTTLANTGWTDCYKNSIFWIPLAPYEYWTSPFQAFYHY